MAKKFELLLKDLDADRRARIRARTDELEGEVETRKNNSGRD